jgi:hypothetical protein
MLNKGRNIQQNDIWQNGIQQIRIYQNNQQNDIWQNDVQQNKDAKYNDNKQNGIQPQYIYQKDILPNDIQQKYIKQ